MSMVIGAVKEGPLSVRIHLLWDQQMNIKIYISCCNAEILFQYELFLPAQYSSGRHHTPQRPTSRVAIKSHKDPIIIHHTVLKKTTRSKMRLASLVNIILPVWLHIALAAPVPVSDDVATQEDLDDSVNRSPAVIYRREESSDGNRAPAVIYKRQEVDGDRIPAVIYERDQEPDDNRIPAVIYTREEDLDEGRIPAVIYRREEDNEDERAPAVIYRREKDADRKPAVIY